MELVGKRAICRHTKRSWNTLMGLRDKEGFPLGRVAGKWVSDTEEIRGWLVKRLRRRCE